MHEASNEDTARAVYCRTTLPFLAERVGHDVEARHNLARPVKTRKKFLVQDRVLRKKDNTDKCFYEKFEHVFFEP
jgi:hypothetical protein